MVFVLFLCDFAPSSALTAQGSGAGDKSAGGLAYAPAQMSSCSAGEVNLAGVDSMKGQGKDDDHRAKWT